MRTTLLVLLIAFTICAEVKDEVVLKNFWGDLWGFVKRTVLPGAADFICGRFGLNGVCGNVVSTFVR